MPIPLGAGEARRGAFDGKSCAWRLRMREHQALAESALAELAACGTNLDHAATRAGRQRREQGLGTVALSARIAMPGGEFGRAL
jgi:hypothetical protein